MEVPPGKKDPCWVAKRTLKFPSEYTLVAAKTYSWPSVHSPMGKEVLSYAKPFHCSCHATWLPCKTSIGCYKIEWIYSTRVHLGCVKLGQFVSKLDLTKSQSMCTQALTKRGSKVDPSFELAPTCDSVWPGLKRSRNCSAFPFIPACNAT